MLINCNNTEVWTRTVMELKLSVAIFILVGLFLQCFRLSHIRHWWFYGVQILGQSFCFHVAFTFVLIINTVQHNVWHRLYVTHASYVVRTSS
jgi:hypothetical protein